MHDLPSDFLQHLLLPWEGRILGHREGKSTTAAGNSVEEKKNEEAAVRYLKGKVSKADFSGDGFKFSCAP